MSRPSAGAAFLLTAMLAATPIVAKAAAHDTPPPPPELTGLVARDLTGISARPERAWQATLAVLRENGVPVPAGASWGWLPYDTNFGGVAQVNENRVLIDPFTAVGDGRHMVAAFAHEAAHLASHAAHQRDIPIADPMEEAAAEAVARDLVPAIWRRLRIQPTISPWAYAQQVSWLRRATTRGCKATMGGTPHQVDRCARHTRRWFLTTSDAERRTFATRWATGRVPGVTVDVALLPGPARTIAQQLIVERRRWETERRALRTEIRELHAASRFRPTVAHAVSLAAAVTGASRPAMVGLFTCEATMNPKAASPGGLYVGLGQFDGDTWGTTRLGRAGFDRTDPYAMAFATVELFDRRGRGPWPVCGRSLR